MTATAKAKTTYSFPVPDLSDDGLAKVTAQVAESAAEYDRTGEIPWEGLEAIYQAGFITASIAPEHGGPGITARDAARAVAAVGEGDPSVAIILANTLLTHGTIAAVPLSWYEPHYEDFLARSAQGIALANGLGAEPDLGASARGGLPATNLTRSGDGWVLNGRKGWGTGGTALTYHVSGTAAMVPWDSSVLARMIATDGSPSPTAATTRAASRAVMPGPPCSGAIDAVMRPAR